MESVGTQTFLGIQTHFGVPENFIFPWTRNRCSDDLVDILKEVLGILYPNIEFEIFVAPPEKGSYVDRVWLRGKANGTVALSGVILTAGLLYYSARTYSDTHEEHVIDSAKKCIELQKLLNKGSLGYELDKVSTEKISEICSNVSIKKKKNDFYNTLMKDETVRGIEISSFLNQEGLEITSSGEISSSDFGKYIEPIVDEKIELQSQSGTLELISPVVKQKKEGKGIPWRATYYGEDVVLGNTKVLQNGEDIDFFMQDPDFKDQTRNGERAFKHDDNMVVLFTLKGELKGDIIQNRNIYIQKVITYNKETIPHKERLQREKRAKTEQEQNSSLFDGLRIEN